jgi:membrane fusion protein (multidrug efflux system)
MKVDRPVAGDPEASEGDWRPSDMRAVRRLAMVVLPALALALVGLAYMFTGRFVSTDNAYVKASIISLSPEVSGLVQKVLVHENEPVKAGQVLVQLDATMYIVGAAMAETGIKNSAVKYEGDRALLQQKVDAIRQAETDASFAQRELKRQAALGPGKFVSVSKLDDAKHAYESAEQHLAVLKGEHAEILARLDGDANLPLEKYAPYQASVAQKEFADYYVDHAVVRASVDGIVSRLPNPGDAARTGVPLLSLVATDKVWVDANFKETEITHVHPGQSAEISVDTYPGHVFKGHVESIAQASGAEFALLPAQNTTGNWVKVVQRIPVRIAIDERPSEGPVLRAGMSVTADVDTEHRRIQRWFGASE